MLCYVGGLFEATAGLVLAGIVLELAAYVAYGSEVAERDRRPDTAADGD